MSETLSIVWFRRDLRLRDNPALAAACQGKVLPVFVHDPQDQGPGAPGAASRWWLHHSLAALDADLRGRGLRLLLRRGPALEALRDLARASGAKAVHWNRLYEPALQARDQGLKAALREDGLEAHSHNAALLREPWELATGQGRPYQVFSPFWRALQRIGPSGPAGGLPRRWSAPARWPASLALSALELLPQRAWADGFGRHWRPGEAGAANAMKRFESGLKGYARDRDLPALEGGTSRLSPHLHFGEIGPRQVWRAFEGQPGAAPFLRELAWREFSHHLLHHFPRTQDRPLRPAFEGVPWRRDAAGLAAWQKGLTGYPIVDAGLRELWATGFMHNRVRMIAASFLVKDLLLDWRQGAAWFMDCLVDADLAQNSLGWQWCAGCGADAAPFFRIFNPCLQGRRFDPEGLYVKRWVPELAGVDPRWVHEPWNAPVAPTGYPAPILDHGQARRRALDWFQAVKKGARS